MASCAAGDAAQDGPAQGELGSTQQALSFDAPWEPTTPTPFSFQSHVSTSGAFADGDVRLDAVSYSYAFNSYAGSTARHTAGARR